MPSNIEKLNIVARKSRLAILQAEIVKQQLENFYPNLQVNIQGISTVGDATLDIPLTKIGGKGLFVKELEDHLLRQHADIAVHSLKDMPTVLPVGLSIGAVLARADPRDVFVSDKYASLAALPAGGIIGSSSLRRQAQILALRNDVTIVALRGNVETRINKMLAGQYAAIILAAAGLQRLNLTRWLNCPFALDEMLPAAAQGALAIEYRTDDNHIADLLAPLHDPVTAACVAAERAMILLLNGNCQTPIAGFASINNDLLTLRGLVASVDGVTRYTASHTGKMQDAEEIGKIVGGNLLQQGAAAVISL